MVSRPYLLVFVASLATGCLRGQIIEFDSGGLHYQTLTKAGVTVMFATMPSHIREYSIVQVAISNGSPVAWVIKPEDFSFRRTDGEVIRATPARNVVISLMNHASRNDVIKLVSTYEQTIYGLANFRSTNGFESRRQNALAEVSSAKLKAAAAASAIALVLTKLAAGQSTDGAVFYTTAGKPLGSGHLVITVAGEVFEFETFGEHSASH